MNDMFIAAKGINSSVLTLLGPNPLYEISIYKKFGILGKDSILHSYDDNLNVCAAQSSMVTVRSSINYGVLNENTICPIPRFIFLDFCGFLSKNKKTIKTIFNKQKRKFGNKTFFAYTVTERGNNPYNDIVKLNKLLTGVEGDYKVNIVDKNYIKYYNSNNEYKIAIYRYYDRKNGQTTHTPMYSVSIYHK